MKRIFIILCLLLVLICVVVACDSEGASSLSVGGKNNLLATNGDGALSDTISSGQSAIDPCAPGTHVVGDWEDLPATCEKGARKEKKCTVCGILMEVQTYGAALGHNKGAWENVEATCTTPACSERKCTTCKQVVESIVLGNALGHTGSWTTVKRPTASQEGLKKRVCARCEEEQTQVIPVSEYAGYAGEEITLLYWKEVERAEFEQKELANDSVLDAIYYRNLNVEEALGVDLVFVSMYAAYGDGVMDEFLRKIDAIHMAHTQDYDIIATYARTEASLAVRGHLQNFAKIEDSKLELENPWWPKSMVEAVTFGNDSYYFISGDMSTNVLWMMHAIFLNEDLCTDLGMDLPYDMVRNGTWTIDAMINMTEDLWVDLDNNGVISVNDQVGFCALNYVCDSFYPGCNMRYIEADETTLLKVSSDYTSAKASRMFDKLGKWARSNAIWITNGNSNQDMQSNTRQIFKKGRTLMWLEHTLYGEAMLVNGKVDFNYGILPTPKYDTNQKNYYTGMGNPWTLYGIFVDFDDRDDKQATLSMFTEVLECYAAEAYSLTTPAVIAAILGSNADQNDLEMFEYVHSGIVFDLGKIFSAITDNMPEVASNAIVDRTYWASKYKVILPGSEAKLARICADFRQSQLEGN